jgi:hypothetical protein
MRASSARPSAFSGDIEMNPSQLAALAGLAACLVLESGPLHAGGEAPGPSSADDAFHEWIGLSLHDGGATRVGYEMEDDDVLRAEVMSSASLADFELDFDDGVLLGAFHDEGPHDQGAAVPGPPGHHESLANAATNPVAPLIQFQIQNTFVGESNAGDGYSNAFVIQPVIPYKIGDLAMITRLTLPLLVATPDLPGGIGRQYGLGDTVALNALTFKIDDGFWKGMIGPILTVTAPTASSDFLGEGKWQAGPGGIYINTANPKIQWGIFGYQQWSFASSGGDSGRPEVSKLFWQPIFNWHFAPGWYTGLGDILYTIDFNNSTTSFPISWRLGKVTKLKNQHVNIFVEAFYDVSSNNPGNEWGAKINLTLLFPE